MNEEEAIKKKLEAIFPSPEVASKVVDLVVKGSKPDGWSRHSNAPYYKKEYAESIRKSIDKMLESGTDIVYRYDVFCVNTGVSKETLYLRINQSIRYLVERMDTADNKYKNWYEAVNVTRERGVGIVIRFVAGLHEAGSNFEPEVLVPVAQQPVWKQRMYNWLESDREKPFIQEGLALSPDDITQLKLELHGLKTILASVSAATIKIVGVQ